MVNRNRNTHIHCHLLKMSNGKDHYRFTIKFLWDFGWIILCSCIMDEDYMGIKIKDNKKSIHTYSQLRQYIIIIR